MWPCAIRLQYDHFAMPVGAAVAELRSPCAHDHMEWLKRGLGARIMGDVYHADEDKEKKVVMHASVRINGGEVYILDAAYMDKQAKDKSDAAAPPEGGQPTGATIHLNVGDADAAWTRAMEAGATPTQPLADVFWGSRYGRFVDPFGQEWAVCAPLRPSEANTGARADAAAKAADAAAQATAVDTSEPPSKKRRAQGSCHDPAVPRSAGA